MEVSVVKIGNSKGIRFSKTIIERYNIRDTVDLILDKGTDYNKASCSSKKRLGKSLYGNACQWR